MERGRRMSVILHVDDENVIRLLYKEVFEERGYQVIQAASGEEALTLLKEASPDIIILDLKMRGMGGVGFLKKFKTLRLSIPIVISSAYPYDEETFAAKTADAYVVKSGDMSDLVQMVDNLLTKSSPASS